MHLFDSTELEAHPRFEEFNQNLLWANQESLKVTQEIIADMPLKVRFQALNRILVNAFVFHKLDLLKFAIENEITAQEGFFDDLGNALELFSRFKGHSHDETKTPEFCRFLQAYAQHLGAEFAQEAVMVLVPSSTRSETQADDYLAEFENFVHSFTLVFGDEALVTVETGNSLLRALSSSHHKSVVLSSARTVLGSRLMFDSPAALGQLLAEEKLADSPEFISAYPESVRAVLARIETPADHQPLINLLIQYAGQIVLPVMIEQPKRFNLGSLRMASTTHEVLHGSEKGRFTLREHRLLFEKLVTGILQHPAFELNSHENPEIRSICDNEFSIVSGALAYRQDVHFRLKTPQLEDICQQLSISRTLLPEDIQSLDDLLLTDVTLDVRQAFRVAQKHQGEHEKIVRIGQMPKGDMIKACLCQIAYEQLHKQSNKFNASRAPFLEASKTKTKNVWGNAQAGLKLIAPYLASKMDDAFILSVAPKDKHYLLEMLKAGIIKDRQYADLLTPAQRESLLVGDLGL